MTSRLTSAVVFGILVGAIGAAASVAPFVMRLEENAGLDWLFNLRGTRNAPADVVVINIDKESADRLGLANDPATWPRSLHAQLIRQLAKSGVAVIAFDMFFDDRGSPADNADMAQAMRDAGNIVLSARLKKDILQSQTRQAISMKLLTPVEPLNGSALAVAPFPLPVVPVKVSQFWVFQTGSGDLATLPAAVMQAHALWLHTDVAGMVRKVDPQGGRLGPSGPEAIPENHLEDFVQQIRDLFLAEPDLYDRILASLSGPSASAETQAPAIALVAMYGGPDSRFLNYYGPPGSFTTVPYHRVLNEPMPRALDGKVIDLRGKVVFVGFSERLQTEQKDTFYSVFSQESGLNLSGVEIAATATANLLENRPVRPLSVPAGLVLLIVFGTFLGFICRLLPGAVGSMVGVLGATGYLAGATYLFSSADLWLPIIVPLFLQTPLAVFGAILLQFFQVRDQRERIRAALGRYVPPKMVERLASEGLEAGTSAEIVYGTCMATDAAQYSLMSETLAPDELGRVMNTYYEILFVEVGQHDGMVSDVVGDSMMAIWASSLPQREIRLQACRAALKIRAALAKRAAAGERAALPTRFGLNSGEIRLGNIGAKQHVEYRAVGDIVNTASRIEGLNKVLGTQIIASAETVMDLDEFLTRDLGTFLLAGKSLPIRAYELIDQASGGADETKTFLALFARALAQFREQHWSESARLFQECLGFKADDGPTQFYARLCDEYVSAGPSSFQGGAIRISSK